MTIKTPRAVAQMLDELRTLVEENRADAAALFNVLGAFLPTSDQSAKRLQVIAVSIVNAAAVELETKLDEVTRTIGTLIQAEEARHG